MPRFNGRKVLNNPLASRVEIESAIAWLQDDIAYMYRAANSFNSQGEFSASIAESLELILQLQDKLADTVAGDTSDEAFNDRAQNCLI